MFGKHGEVTDCKLLKDKNGKSRRCAYVGYSKESDAAKALKKLNGTTLGISKELFLSMITRLNSVFFLDFRTQGMELESK